jgi:hypothetical protein
MYIDLEGSVGPCFNVGGDMKNPVAFMSDLDIRNARGRDKVSKSWLLVWSVKC